MRRVEVQRWPAVPTAPNRIARVARSRFASSVTMMALLPPSSRMVRPKRSRDRRGHVLADLRRAGERDRAAAARSFSIRSPTLRPGPIDEREDARDAPWSAITRLAMCCTAIAHSGVGPAGFQTTGSPQTAASARVPRPHRHREVERGDDADDAERVPLLHHPVRRAAPRPSSGRRAGARGRRRSRRCRSSPALRRGPRRGSSPSRALTRSPSGSFISRSALPRSRTTSPRFGAGTMRQVANAATAVADDLRRRRRRSPARTRAIGSPVVGL